MLTGAVVIRKGWRDRKKERLVLVKIETLSIVGKTLAGGLFVRRAVCLKNDESRQCVVRYTGNLTTNGMGTLTKLGNNLAVKWLNWWPNFFYLSPWVHLHIRTIQSRLCRCLKVSRVLDTKYSSAALRNVMF